MQMNQTFDEGSNLIDLAKKNIFSPPKSSKFSKTFIVDCKRCLKNRILQCNYIEKVKNIGFLFFFTPNYSCR